MTLQSQVAGEVKKPEDLAALLKLCIDCHEMLERALKAAGGNNPESRMVRDGLVGSIRELNDTIQAQGASKTPAQTIVERVLNDAVQPSTEDIMVLAKLPDSELNAVLTAKDSNGDSILHRAMKTGDPKVIERFKVLLDALGHRLTGEELEELTTARGGDGVSGFTRLMEGGSVDAINAYNNMVKSYGEGMRTTFLTLEFDKLDASSIARIKNNIAGIEAYGHALRADKCEAAAYYFNSLSTSAPWATNPDAIDAFKTISQVLANIKHAPPIAKPPGDSGAKMRPEGPRVVYEEMMAKFGFSTAGAIAFQAALDREQYLPSGQQRTDDEVYHQFMFGRPPAKR